MDDKLLKKSTIDSFKIKILKNETFYILSRLNISKQLILIQIDNNDALKISKELKKLLFKKNISEINESEMNNYLFDLLKIYNYHNYINIFIKTSKFNQLKVPILFLLGGTSLSLRSSFATKLQERLNISNIISSELILNFTKVLNIKNDKFVYKDKYTKEQIKIRRGSNMDLLKCIGDGKPLIIEGNINFDLFLRSKNKNSYKDILLNFDKYKKNDKDKEDLWNHNNFLNLFNQNIDFMDSLKLNLNYMENQNSYLDPELILWKKLYELKNKNCIIFPIYLFINKYDHYNMIKSYSDKNLFKKYNIAEVDKKKKHKELLSALTKIKYNDVLNDKCLFLPIDSFDYFEKSINEIHSLFLKKIDKNLLNN